jgi:hypothetical protein
MLPNLIRLIRENKYVSWCFAMVVGFLYRYSYGLAKDGIWANRKLNFIAGLVDPFSKIQMTLLTVTLNFFVDLSSSIIPAMLCGIILIYVFHEKSFLFGLGSAAMFLVLSSRLWRFWQAPNIGMQISTLIGPVLSVLVLIFAIWILLKYRKRITPPSTQTRD